MGSVEDGSHAGDREGGEMSDAKQQPAAKTPAQTTLDAVRAWYDENTRRRDKIMTDKRGEFTNKEGVTK